MKSTVSTCSATSARLVVVETGGENTIIRDCDSIMKVKLKKGNDLASHLDILRHRHPLHHPVGLSVQCMVVTDGDRCLCLTGSSGIGRDEPHVFFDGHRTYNWGHPAFLGRNEPFFSWDHVQKPHCFPRVQAPHRPEEQTLHGFEIPQLHSGQGRTSALCPQAHNGKLRSAQAGRNTPAHGMCGSRMNPDGSWT